MNSTIIQPLWIFALAIIFLASTIHFGYNFLLSEELLLNDQQDDPSISDDSWIKKTLSMPLESSQGERMFVNHDYSIYLYLQDHCNQTLAKSRPKFNKFVLFIIDALRVDFVRSIVGENQHEQSLDPLLPYTEKVMQTNGIGLISVATIPTVTLPRIKALITGTLPSFMDYFLNLNPVVNSNNNNNNNDNVNVESKTKKHADDNLVEQFNRQGKSIVFYGDDTWTQLFSSSANEIFKRINVTSSLFATDYTEVDSNVTYNVNRELKTLNDWDVMILHYLGVDHIGHLRGFHSELFPDKFHEMDNVFRNIFDTITYSASVNDSYLIVITGDHGMTDAGNHGGHTIAETHTALIFISTNKIHYQPHQPSSKNDHKTDKEIAIFQLDFAATVAVLFGLELPRKNQGRIISTVLERFNIPHDEHLCHLFRNALQTQKLLMNNGEETKLLRKQFTTALNHHWNFIGKQNQTTSSEESFEKAQKSYQQLIGQIQHEFVSQTIDRSFWSSLIGAILISSLTVVVLLLIEIICNRSSSIVIIHLDRLLSGYYNSNGHYYHDLVPLRYSSSPLATIIIMAIFMLRFCLLGSINFMLNEHLFWYYSTLFLLSVNLFIIIKYVFVVYFYNFSFVFIPFYELFYELFSNRTCHNHHKFNCLVIVNSVGLIVTFFLLTYWRMPVLTDQDLNRIDITDYLQRSSNKRLLSSLLITALIVTASMIYGQTGSRCSYYFLITSFVLTYFYRSYLNQVTVFRFSALNFLAKWPNFCAQIIFTLVLFIIMDCIYRKFNYNITIPILSGWIVSNSKKQPVIIMKGICLNTLITIWIIMSILLLEPSLMPVFTLNILMEKMLYSILSETNTTKMDVKYRQLFYRFGLYACMAYSSFYQLGNRNSLSTISVNSCFIGLNQHIPIVCGLFMTISIYSTMIYWMIMFFIRFRDDFFINNIDESNIPKNYQTFTSIITITLINRFAMMSMTMFVTWWLRDHLFIWSIICPKLIYEFCFTILITIFTWTMFILYTYDDCFIEMQQKSMMNA